MEDFEKKVTLMDSDSMEVAADNCGDSSKTVNLLRRFLEVQQRRALAYAKLKKYAPLNTCIIESPYI